MATTTTTSQVTFTADIDTPGFPAVVDGPFLDAVARSKCGGGDTQQYFDALNQTSDFWGDLATGAITFAPGVDPHGNPVYMASNGNVEMRLTAAYVDNGGDPTKPCGQATVATRNTTTQASAWTAVALRVALLPPYLKLTSDLFSKLLTPVYRNTARVLTALAARLQQATQVETPAVDALEEASAVAEEESAVVDEVTEVGVEGLEAMAIDWGAVVLDLACLAPLMALPMIAEVLGHEMAHALIVQNLTDIDFTWDLTVVHGRTALQPGQDAIPRLVVQPGHDGDVTLSSQAAFQHVNSTNYGAIGYVVRLQPADGSPAALCVVDIPWAGDNTVWVGAETNAETAYAEHSGRPDGLSVTADFGAYRVTLSLNAASGKTYDTYYYCSTAVIEPAIST